jgi:hypothetical protein
LGEGYFVPPGSPHMGVRVPLTMFGRGRRLCGKRLPLYPLPFQPRVGPDAPSSNAAAIASLPGGHETGKLSFTVRAQWPRSFEVAMKFRVGRLRLGYLRSFEGQASSDVQVFFPVDNATGPSQTSWVVNGTWDAPVSIYTNDEFELPEPLQRAMWPARCGWFSRGKCFRYLNSSDPESRVPVLARVRVSSIPRALDVIPARKSVKQGDDGYRETGIVGRGSGNRDGLSTGWAPFSLYTLSSY